MNSQELALLSGPTQGDKRVSPRHSLSSGPEKVCHVLQFKGISLAILKLLDVISSRNIFSFFCLIPWQNFLKVGAVHSVSPFLLTFGNVKEIYRGLDVVPLKPSALKDQLSHSSGSIFTALVEGQQFSQQGGLTLFG